MNFDNDTNVIDVAIRRLRIKIDDEFDTKLIHTVRGMGYRLDAVDVSASNKAASETEDSQYDK
jgi:two-component system copper resistance phosphate regulon response regulator CusR